jgi:hypothetical protein
MIALPNYAYYAIHPKMSRFLLILAIMKLLTVGLMCLNRDHHIGLNLFKIKALLFIFMLRNVTTEISSNSL